MTWQSSTSWDLPPEDGADLRSSSDLVIGWPLSGRMISLPICWWLQGQGISRGLSGNFQLIITSPNMPPLWTPPMDAASATRLSHRAACWLLYFFDLPWSSAPLICVPRNRLVRCWTVPLLARIFSPWLSGVSSHRGTTDLKYWDNGGPPWWVHTGRCLWRLTQRPSPWHFHIKQINWAVGPGQERLQASVHILTGAHTWDEVCPPVCMYGVSSFFSVLGGIFRLI